MRVYKNKGFTLIEIIVVTVILAVLMAVAVPSVMSYINEADDAKYVAVARSAFLNARKAFVYEYAAHGHVQDDEYHTMQVYVGQYTPAKDALENAEKEIGKRKDYGDQVKYLFLCKVKLTPSKTGIASMTVAIRFIDKDYYKLVTIDANDKVTVTKETFTQISTKNGVLSNKLTPS